MESCEAGMPPRREQVIVQNRVLSYLRWGEGERTVLLLHGITSSARAWWRVAPAIANLGYCVVAFDMPGHGESMLLGTHELPSIAEHLAHACQQLGLTPHAIVGHSWGGATALLLAPRLAVTRLVLIDPALTLSEHINPVMLPRFLEGIGEPPAVSIPWLSQRHKHWHRCDVQWKAEALVQCRREAVEGFFLHSGQWNLTSQFAQCSIPTLCLVAAPAATVIPSEFHGAIQAALAEHGGAWHQLEGTDHNMYRGGFDVTMPHIVHWLKETSPWPVH